ncbi:phage integrase family protein [Galbibacter orientalis DSM 19592]|uniref:Phage integrase family protein n=1 Tax=Galbibacter orientalis DSM 19592 TaxID=926559 RepID=I3C582_9FLAO|nr:site-specific integrase [Galbibacter orientalis]EIJ38775.1 phage integrase family protein [Galbibacter orientalis DSM 19592]
MQVSFYVVKNKIDKSGLSPVYYSITVDGQRIRKQVKGVKCSLSQWMEDNQRIRPPRKGEAYNYHIEYNKKIDELETDLKKLFRYILLNEITSSKEFILEKLDTNLSATRLSHEFWPSFVEFIEKSKATKVERTIKSYVTISNFFKTFEKNTGYALYFDTINQTFFENLQEYTFLKKKYTNSYFACIIKILKTFMTWASDRGYHDNHAYKKFKAKEDPIEVIFLTIEELMTLYQHEFTSKKLEHVRDTYCFSCFTGLRFSDVKQLRSSNIQEDHIRLNVQKTKTIDQVIPLNNYSKALLDKYKDTIYEPLPVISSQKFNEYIKKCCKEAEINILVTITRYIGQRRVDKTAPKYEFITSHTARKTFVTNSLILGMKEIVIRNITGHKKESSFRRYVKIAEDFKRQEMDSTWNKI